MEDFTSLGRRASEAAADWGLRLLDDLTARHRWAASVPVESYLERLPGLAAEAEVVLDLLVAEWTLRRQAGEAVALSGYLQRFPTRQGDIRMLWQADQLTPPPVGHSPSPLDAGQLPDWYTGIADLPVVFGEHRLLREFGGGGMARVFLAEPLTGGEAVALKVPKLPLGEDAQAVADRTSRRLRFLREARLTSRLDHPRLCRVLEVGDQDGLPYFTMRYYPCGSVGEELQAHGRFAERNAARLIADVARALQHAHSLGILHRDLKPSNLLRDEQGQVVAVDFGLALPLEGDGSRLTSTGKILGTVQYLSPEQAHGRADLTPACDIFSLGVVLYELLAGRPPFTGNLVQVVMAIVEETAEPLEKVREGISPALAAICRKAMAKEPTDRYTTMDAFADDLERFLAGTWASPQEAPASVVDANIGKGTRQPPKRIRWWVAGGVAAGLLLAGVALRAIVGGNGPPPTPPKGGVSHPLLERAVVSARQPLGLRGLLQLLHDDLDQLEAVDRPHMRYLSLMAVHDNPYVTDEDYGLHLDALHRVLNRLSRDKLNVPVYPVDASGCLLRIDLRDLGWDPAIEWSLLLKAEPYGVRYDAVNPDETLRKLARETYALAGINSLFDSPCARADWLIATATQAPLFDQLQKSDGQDRHTPPFDLTDGTDPVARVVQLYQANAVDARVAAAELGLGTVAELDARWPADKLDLRKALDQSQARSAWAGENGQALFADCVRLLKLGVPRYAAHSLTLAGTMQRTLTGKGPCWSTLIMLGTHRSGIQCYVFLLVTLATLCFFSGSGSAAGTDPPELLLPLGHTWPVSSVAISEDGKRVLTGSYDKTAILWDADTGKPLQIFKGHTLQVNSVVMSGDGKRVLTGSSDQTAILWDAESGMPLQTFKGHTGGIQSVILSGDGKLRVLTGSYDKTAILWDADSGQPLQTFKGHTKEVISVALSADGKRVLTGSADGTAILWDAESGKPLQTFKGHTDKVMSVALSGDGKRVLTGSADQTAILRDAESGMPLQTFKHTNVVTSVAMSGDGKRILTGSGNITASALFLGSGDGRAILWDAGTGKPLQTIKWQNGPIISVAMSGDGKRILTGPLDSTAILWDAGTGEPLQTFKRHAWSVNSIAISGDGQRVLAGSYDATALFTGAITNPLMLLTGFKAQTAILLDAGTGKPLQAFKGHTHLVNSVALSGDGKRVLTGSADKTAILWDAESGKPLQTFKGHTGIITAVAMSGDGKRVLTGSADLTAILWDPATGKPLQTLKGHTGTITSVVLSADGKLALTGSGDPPVIVNGPTSLSETRPGDRTAILWDADTGRPLQTFKGHTWPVTCVAMSGDGKRVVTGSSDNTAMLWDAESGKPLQTFKGHTNSVISVALSADGKSVLTGSADLTAILWDPATGKPIQTFKGNNAYVEAVAFGPREAYFVTASSDGTIRIWKPQREKPIFSFLSAGDDWLFWTPEGYYTCSPNGESLIAWKIKDDSPQGYRIVGPDQFRKKFYRPDLFRHLLAELDLDKALALADKERGHTPETPSNFADELPPSAIIAKPLKSGEIIKGEECEVAVKATPNGDNFVTSLQLLVDGRPYPGARASFSPKAEPATVTWKVNLPVGKCRVRVVAESVKGSTSQSDEVEITREGETQPQLLLLGVGVSEYEKIDRNGTEAASDSVNRFLEAQLQYGKTLFLDPMRIPLVDQQKQPLPAGKATKAAVLDAFDELARRAQETWKAGKHPVSVIILAGHGELTQEGTAYFLVTDSDRQRLRATAISEEELKEALRAIPGKVVLFLDACHAGAFAEKLYRELTDRDCPVLMICSCGADEKSGESRSLKAGLFTEAVIEGLSGKATKDQDGAISADELFEYVRKRVKDLSEDQQHPICSSLGAKDARELLLAKP